MSNLIFLKIKIEKYSRFYIKIITLIFCFSVIVSCQSSKTYTSRSLEVINRIEKSENEIDKRLASITLREYSDLIEQRTIEKELLTNLVNQLNPRGLDLEPRYFLEFDIDIESDSSRTKTSGASGRYNKTMKLRYKLKELGNENALVSDRIIKSVGSYESSENRYSTYISENKVEKDLAKELAVQLKIYLINDLYEYNKVE